MIRTQKPFVMQPQANSRSVRIKVGKEGLSIRTSTPEQAQDLAKALIGLFNRKWGCEPKIIIEPGWLAAQEGGTK